MNKKIKLKNNDETHKDKIQAEPFFYFLIVSKFKSHFTKHLRNIAVLLLISFTVTPSIFSSFVLADAKEQRQRALDLEIDKWHNRPVLVKRMAKDLEKDFLRLGRFEKEIVEDKEGKKEIKDKDEESKDREENNKNPEEKVEEKKVIVLSEAEKVELRQLNEKCNVNYSGNMKLFLMETKFKGQEYVKIKEQLNKEVKDIIDKLAVLKKDEREFAKRITPSKQSKLKKIKEIIDRQYDGNIEDYVEATLPKKVNILDKKYFYLLYIFRPHTNGIRSEEYKLISKIQEDYRDKGLLVLGVTPEYLAGPGTAQEERFKKNVAELERRLLIMDEEMPRFLVGVDETATIISPPVYRDYLNISKLMTPAGLISQKVPQIFMINKRSEIVRTCEVKDIHYYLDDAIEGNCKWSEYLKSHAARSHMYAYAREASRPGRNNKDMANKIYELGENDPVVLIEFAKTLLSLPKINKGRDPQFALKCCRRAFQITQSKNIVHPDPQVSVALAQAYFENGELVEALKYAALAKKSNFKEVLRREEGRLPYYFLDEWMVAWKEIQKRVGNEGFRKVKEAERLFAVKYWSLAISRAQQNDETKTQLKNLAEQIYNGLQYDVGMVTELLYFMCSRSDPMTKKKIVKLLCTKMFKRLNKSLSDEINASPLKKLTAKHQDQLATLAYYEYKFGTDLNAVATQLEKAIRLNPSSEKARHQYSFLLKKIKTALKRRQ